MVYQHKRERIAKKTGEAEETIRRICEDMADISAMLAARSRELDRRERFDEEIGKEIDELKERNYGHQ